MVPRSSGAHAGEDVATYAIGPMSHLFVGVREQSYIMHALSYAACLGEYQNRCHLNFKSASGVITEVQPPVRLEEEKIILELSREDATQAAGYTESGSENYDSTNENSISNTFESVSFKGTASCCYLNKLATAVMISSWLVIRMYIQ